MMKLINLTSHRGPGVPAPEELLHSLSPEPGSWGAGGSLPLFSPKESWEGYENNLEIWGKGNFLSLSEVLLVCFSEKLSKYIKCDTKSYIIHFYVFAPESDFRAVRSSAI